MREPASDIGAFVRSERRALGWSQQQAALYAGVSRNFLGDLEAGKGTLQMDSVNQVLALFGKRLGLVDLERSGS